jgi:uncharacterized protein YndB with AHSA1/START domain
MMYQLRMEQQFNVSRAELFDAWCRVETIKKWFAPGDMCVPEAEADVRVGGRYRVVMEETDGSQHIVTGQYLEVIVNEKLVFDWRWEGSEVTTRVSLVFGSIDEDRSSLELVHVDFQDQDACDHHHQGWTACLENLRALAEPAELTSH